MICKTCGRQLPEVSVACVYCGEAQNGPTQQQPIRRRRASASPALEYENRGASQPKATMHTNMWADAGTRNTSTPEYKEAAPLPRQHNYSSAGYKPATQNAAKLPAKPYTDTAPHKSNNVGATTSQNGNSRLPLIIGASLLFIVFVILVGGARFSNNGMTIALILVFSVGSYGLVWGLKKKKTNELASKGRYVERGNEFFRQKHFFFTQVFDFSAIVGAIDKNALGEEKISCEPNVRQGQVVFHNKISFGTFDASLVYAEQREKDGLYTYLFQVEAWREVKHSITRQDLLGANVLLTLIEKAFLRLDPETEVQRHAGEHNSKLSFM